MRHAVSVFLLILPAMGATIYDCRLYDCDSAFARVRTPAPNPPVPAGAITNALGHAVWGDRGARLSFYDGTLTRTASADSNLDFAMFDLSDNDIIGWQEAPGSFWLKDARTPDGFSQRLSWDPSSGGGFFWTFDNATPVRFDSSGNAILMTGAVKRSAPGPGPILETDVLVAFAFGPFAPTPIPEPSSVALTGAVLLAIFARRISRI